jgi:LysM domain
MMPSTRRRHAALAAAFTFPVLCAPSLAFAQAGPAPVPAPAAVPGAPAPSPGGAIVPPSTTSPGGGFGWGNPQSSNGTIGGGNATESSAHPVTGDQEDTFDFGKSGGAGGAVHGDSNGPVFLGGGVGFGGETPYSHIVRRGDTLWGICGTYFQNPYQWPRIWSYNPQIHNPHWIYPGDEVRLRQDRDLATGTASAPKPALPYQGAGMSLVDRRRQVPHNTVFLRDQGWIREPNDEIWGDVTGASADKMFLSDRDEIYLHIDKGHDVHMGQELTIFRPLHLAAAGTIVQIAGTARIDQWDAQDRVARARIVESLNVIERGAKVGPLARSFEVVPPRRNDVEVVDAHVLASLHPNEFFGENQIVFIDKGDKDGLKVGNRLTVMRRGDAWRQSLVTTHAGDRVSADDETPMPPLEPTPGSHQDEGKYPDEPIAELRVVEVKQSTATCLVTHSRVELEPYDRAVAHKGY